MNKKQLLTLIIIIMMILTGCEKTGNSINTKEGNASCSDEPSSFIGNPAAFYCTNVMGYEYQVITEDDGAQKGQCIMPDEQACDQWAFYAGECGQEYSYCASEGMSIETRYDGNDPYSSTYGVCIGGSEERSEFKISDIINFNLKPSEKAPSEKETRTGDLPVASDSIRASLPAHFDWRDIDGHDWMTPVKNQGGCGSCWAFSAVGALEPYYNFINNNPDLNLDLSEENLVSDCFYTGCDGGWTEDALIYARDVGIVDEVCMPYTATDSACASMCVDPERYTTDQVVWDYYTLDVDTLKYLIVNYGPVSVYLKMDGDWNGDIYECDALEEWDTNHAVVVVGYDDPGQYWIVKNSWGTDMYGGEDGYFKVGFNQCNINTTFYAYLPTNFLNTYLPLLSTSGTPFTIKPILTSPSEGQIINTLKPTITWEIDNSLHDLSYIYYQ
ncbi:MAG: C1 family peptidase, partial [Chloroflexota bacterium]|nr:C1 family peptidase [Chloroflexota bacterium]